MSVCCMCLCCEVLSGMSIIWFMWYSGQKEIRQVGALVDGSVMSVCLSDCLCCMCLVDDRLLFV